ncbi:MAG: hypothetical protein AB1782_12805 [Cyanobacteriota bacterium]
MLDTAVKSPFNNSNGLGSGTYVKGKSKKSKNKNQKEEYENLNSNFFGIFDELANVVSAELRAMERAKRVNINFNTRF